MTDPKIINQINEKARSYSAEILVVSKNRSNDSIMALYDHGFRAMGENRVQALLEKKDDLPSDISWHVIGHLQKNKVKYVALFVAMIHSCDSLALLKEINKQAKKNDRIIDVLLQFKVAEEDSKFGLSPTSANSILEDLAQLKLVHINIRGIMGMGSFTDNQTQVRGEFKQLKSLFDVLKSEFFSSKDDFDTLSMGMSGDYEIALEEGSTLLRLGSILFN